MSFFYWLVIVGLVSLLYYVYAGLLLKEAECNALQEQVETLAKKEKSSVLIKEAECIAIHKENAALSEQIKSLQIQKTELNTENKQLRNDLKEQCKYSDELSMEAFSAKDEAKYFKKEYERIEGVIAGILQITHLLKEGVLPPNTVFYLLELALNPKISIGVKIFPSVIPPDLVLPRSIALMFFSQMHGITFGKNNAANLCRLGLIIRSIPELNNIPIDMSSVTTVETATSKEPEQSLIADPFVIYREIVARLRK